MFSGIVAAVGRVSRADKAAGGVRLRVDAAGLDLGDVAIGDSIAVDGVCLTVVAKSARAFEADVSRETLKSTMGYAAGSRVNLEMALRPADRLGGHLVSGHVDGIGTVKHCKPAGGSRLLALAAPRGLAKYIVRKGSIAVNGVSLTVNAVKGTAFTVNLIPHTLAATNLGGLKARGRVNLEVDMLARYVEQIFRTSRFR